MDNPTDTNQASEDEQAMQHICRQTGEHYYASESIPGGLIHWIRICMTCGHKDDKDLNEQVKTLIRTEKLKLLAEVRERVVGENERIDIQSDYDKLDVPHIETDKYPGLDSVIQASRNLCRNRQRAEIDKLEAEL